MVEATGGYEKLVVAELVFVKLPACVVNPKRVRNFTRSVGQRVKTDKIDVHILAQFAQAVRPTPRPPHTEGERLSALISRRQVIDILTAEQNRLATAHLATRKRVEKHIEWLLQELADLESEINQFI